jgi:uncharacterized membrane protein
VEGFLLLSLKTNPPDFLMQSLKLQKSYDENAFIVVENVLTLMDVQASRKSIQQIQFLPHFPSLSALGLAFNEFGIETFATRLTIEQLLEMDCPLIAHLRKNEGCFVIVKEILDGKITYHDTESGWITESLDQFSQRWTGITMLLEKTPHAGDRNFSLNRRNEILDQSRRVAVIGLSAVLFLACLIVSTSVSGLFVKILLMTGILSSALLVATEFGSDITKSFCHAGKKTDCNSVLKSPAATLFGWLKMTDVGLIWFSGSLLACVWGDVSGRINDVMGGLLVLNFVALAYVPFSIGYQWLKVKRWCTLCLTVQAILVVNFFVLYSYSSSSKDIFIDNIALYALAIAFTTMTLFWLWVKPMIADAQQLPFRQQELYKLKHDTELFKHLLKDHRTAETLPLPIEFRIGHEQAPLQLTMVTNPFCDPCKKAHRLMEPLLQQMDEQLCVTFRFLVDFKNAKDEGRTFVLHFLSLPNEIQQRAYHDWIQLSEYNSWSKRYPAAILPEAESVLREHAIWCDWVQVSKTPTFFLNNHETPEQFGLEELMYHVRNFKGEEVVRVS